MRVRSNIPTFLQPLHTDEFAPRPTSEQVAGARVRAHELAEQRGGRRPGRPLARSAGHRGRPARDQPAVRDRVLRGARRRRARSRRGRRGTGRRRGRRRRADALHRRPRPRTDRRAHDRALQEGDARSGGRGSTTSSRSTSPSTCAACSWRPRPPVAVLSSAPGVGEHRQLYNSELSATRTLFDELGARDRLLNHAVVDPTQLEDVDLMSQWVEDHQPAAWKVYTLGEVSSDASLYANLSWRETIPGIWKSGWMLDDDDRGASFMARVEELARVGGPRIICAHKGLSGLVDTGSPRDIGPASLAHPDLAFVVYHSGYEIAIEEEGPFTEETARRRHQSPRRDAPRARHRARRERVRGARLHLVPRVVPTAGSRARARQDAARRGRGQRGVGHRQHLVRAVAAAHRLVPARSRSRSRCSRSSATRR